MVDFEDLTKEYEVFKKVDDFIKLFEEKNIQLKPKAQEIMITEDKADAETLANKIAEEIAIYQKICGSERVIEKLLGSKQLDGKDFVFHLNNRSDLRKQKLDVVNELFRLINLAYCNNLIEEIGLGKKLKFFEEENENLKRKNASLRKLNDRLLKENTRLHRLLPDALKGGGEVGELGKFDS